MNGRFANFLLWADQFAELASRTLLSDKEQAKIDQLIKLIEEQKICRDRISRIKHEVETDGMLSIVQTQNQMLSERIITMTEIVEHDHQQA